MTEIVQCRSCHRNILFGHTPSGGLMPLEYDKRNIPEGTVLNVAYLRKPSGRVTCKVLAQAVAERADMNEIDPLDEGYVLTVAHFVTCPQAVAHRKARGGQIPGVIAFPTSAERNRRRNRPQLQPLLPEGGQDA